MLQANQSNSAGWMRSWQFNYLAAPIGQQVEVQWASRQFGAQIDSQPAGLCCAVLCCVLSLRNAVR